MRSSAKQEIIRTEFGRNLTFCDVKTASFLRVKHAILFIKKITFPNIKVYAMSVNVVSRRQERPIFALKTPAFKHCKNPLLYREVGRFSRG